MKSGDRGVEVRDLQLKLVALGYHLPRFGADGDLGDETLAAISAFRVDQGLMQTADDFDTKIPQKVVKAIEDAYTGLMQRNPPRSPVDLITPTPAGSGARARSGLGAASRELHCTRPPCCLASSPRAGSTCRRTSESPAAVCPT